MARHCPVVRPRQAHVLHEAMERDIIKRDQVVVIGTAALTDPTLPPSAIPKCVDATEVPALVASSLQWTGLAKLDVLMLHIPASPAHFSPLTHLPEVVKALEGEVAKGTIGSYGFSSSAFTAVDDDLYSDGRSSSSSSRSSGSGASSGAGDVGAGHVGGRQPVRKLFAVLESVSGDHNMSCLAYECVGW